MDFGSDEGVVAIDWAESSTGKSLADTKVRYSWELSLDGQFQRVEFTNSKTSGKKRVFVNGRQMHEIRVYRSPNFQYSWPIGGHLLSIVPRTSATSAPATDIIDKLFQVEQKMKSSVDCGFELRIDGLPFSHFVKQPEQRPSRVAGQTSSPLPVQNLSQNSSTVSPYAGGTGRSQMPPTATRPSQNRGRREGNPWIPQSPNQSSSRFALASAESRDPWSMEQTSRQREGRDSYAHGRSASMDPARRIKDASGAMRKAFAGKASGEQQQKYGSLLDSSGSDEDESPPYSAQRRQSSAEPAFRRQSSEEAPGRFNGGCAGNCSPTDPFEQRKANAGCGGNSSPGGPQEQRRPTAGQQESPWQPRLQAAAPNATAPPFASPQPSSPRNTFPQNGFPPAKQAVAATANAAAPIPQNGVQQSGFLPPSPSQAVAPPGYGGYASNTSPSHGFESAGNPWGAPTSAWPAQAPAVWGTPVATSPQAAQAELAPFPRPQRPSRRVPTRPVPWETKLPPPLAEEEKAPYDLLDLQDGDIQGAPQLPAAPPAPQMYGSNPAFGTSPHANGRANATNPWGAWGEATHSAPSEGSTPAWPTDTGWPQSPSAAGTPTQAASSAPCSAWPAPAKSSNNFDWPGWPPSSAASTAVAGSTVAWPPQPASCCSTTSAPISTVGEASSGGWPTQSSDWQWPSAPSQAPAQMSAPAPQQASPVSVSSDWQWQSAPSQAPAQMLAPASQQASPVSVPQNWQWPTAPAQSPVSTATPAVQSSPSESLSRPSHQTPAPQAGAQPTFREVEAELQEMFPQVDRSLVRQALLQCNGDRELAANFLLTHAVDDEADDDYLPPKQQAPAEAWNPRQDSQQSQFMPVNPQASMLPRPSGRRKGVLVGVNYFGTQAELAGCINDVWNMQRLLTQTFGWSTSCLRTLTDDNPSSMPTKSNMESALRWLTDGVQPGDVLFFHFSGHGAQQEDPNGFEEDGMNETVLPVDFQQAGMLTDDHLGDLIVKNLPEGVRLTAVMDCCHSGTGLDLPFTYTNRGWKEETNPYLSVADVQMFSGCEDSDTSADAQGAFGQAGGAMTTAFCDLLREHHGTGMSYPQLMERLHQLMIRRNFSQRPQLTSTQSFAHDRVFHLDDCIPNSNATLGRIFRRQFPPQPRQLPSGLQDMLGIGAAVFGGMVAADMAGGMLSSLVGGFGSLASSF